MKNKKTLWWLQVLLMPVSMVPQAWVFYQGRIGGITLSFFLVNLLFFAFNAYIAWEEKHESLGIYVLWGSGTALGLAVAALVGVPWRSSDSVTTGITVAACLVVVFVQLRKHRMITPLAKGVMGGWCSVVLHAQVILVMYQDQSSSGFSVSMIAVGFVLVTMRMIFTWDSRALFVAESLRLLSIIVTAIAWWMYR